MTTITIVPENPGSLTSSFRAIAGDKQSSGKTAGEALDAITNQLGEADAVTLIVLQHVQPDQYFTAQQQERLTELMSRWRQARAAKQNLSAQEQAELEALVEEETRAATARAAALVQGLHP
jgi:DNA-binding transcriptional regulator YbjK